MDPDVQVASASAAQQLRLMVTINKEHSLLSISYANICIFPVHTLVSK